MTETTSNGKARFKGSVRGEGRYYITLEDIFRMYPWKAQEWDGKGAVPFPYVPKEEITDGPNSVTWQEWRKIMKCYFKHLIRYLMQGYRYTIPWGMGFFSLLKKKRPKPDMKEMMEAKARGEIVPYIHKYPKSAEGYSVQLKWEKGKNTTVNFKWHTFYMIRLEAGVHRAMMKAMNHDRSILYRLKDDIYV